MFGKVRKRHRILILGPPASGKTTIVYRLSKQPVPESMVPTAVNCLEKAVETEDGHKFLFAEQKTETPDASAIIYVISVDNLEVELEILRQFIKNGSQRQLPLLVLVNKYDLTNDDKLDEICAKLTPLVGVDRSWAVWGCSGTENIGLTEAIEWMETKLRIS